MTHSTGRRADETEEVRGGRTTREDRDEQPEKGANIGLRADMLDAVFAAAERRGTDPQGFVRSAVERAIGTGANADDGREVEVAGLKNSAGPGRVSLSRSAANMVRQGARRSPNVKTSREFVEGVVGDEVRAVFDADDGGQQQQGFVPAPDPLGFAAAATGGAVQDPVLRSVRRALGNAAGGGR